MIAMTPAKAKTLRLDRLLVQRGMAGDLKQAQSLILAGLVLVENRLQDKAGTPVSVASVVRIKGEANPYVSRGGLKLKGALESFRISVCGLTALDVGASTGGFTDCLLQAGAAKVYALDVGYGLLAWKLRTDPRVIAIERTNIRRYDGAGITEKIDLVVCDASFISLKRIIPPLLKLIGQETLLLVLVKPQFEVEKNEVGSRGVVRDPSLHDRVLAELEAFCRAAGLTVLGRCESPLTGPAGNREFFLYLQKSPEAGEILGGEKEWA